MSDASSSQDTETPESMGAPSNGWKNIRASLVIAGVQIGGVMLLAFARQQGLIDFETVVRGGMVLVGLGLALVANRIPKHPDGAQPPTLRLAALKQSTLRIAGWALMAGGLAFAGLWAFAPLDVAEMGSVLALGASLVLGLGFVVRWIFVSHHRTPPH